MAVEEISHSGRIVEITPTFTTVEIVSESACGSCHAKALCGLGESRTKAVQVPSVPGFVPGEEVYVNLRRSMGFKAVWLAYMVPLVILVACLMTLLGLGVSEVASGLGAIGAVGIYYLGIWILRDRLRNEYSFYIKKK